MVLIVPILQYPLHDDQQMNHLWIHHTPILWATIHGITTQTPIPSEVSEVLTTPMEVCQAWEPLYDGYAVMTHMHIFRWQGDADWLTDLGGFSY